MEDLLRKVRAALTAVCTIAAVSLVPSAAGAVTLTLACLDIGNMLAACEASARRFEAQTPHTVRVVGAEAAGRATLERYRALFSVTSPRLDVLQFPDAWVPALADDLATLEGATAPDALPAAVSGGIDTGRLVGLPQHVALTLLLLRRDITINEPQLWSELREALISGPVDGPRNLALGGAGPSLFPLFLDWATSFGAADLTDRDALERALEVMNESIGSVASAEVAVSTPAQAADDFAAGEAAALVTRSITLDPEVLLGPVSDVATLLRPRGASSPDDPPLVVTTWYVGVSRHTRRLEPALALARHLGSPQEQRRAAIDFGLAPASLPLYDDPMVQATGPVVRRIAERIDRLQPPPVAAYGLAYLQLADDVAAAVRQMLSGELTPQGTSEAIARAVTRARQGLAG